MTRIRRRHTTSLIALLALLMAMLAPATAFAATGDADTDHGTDETAGSGDDAGSNESDTSDTTQTAEDDEAGQQASMSSRKSDTSDKRGFNDKHEGKAKGKDKAWTPTSGWGEATDAASFTTALTASFASGATVTATSVPAGLAHTYEVSTEGPDTLTDAEATWSGKHLASWSGSAACDTTGGGTWTFKLDLKGLKLLDHSCDGDAATSGDGEGGDTGDGDGDDADEDDSDDESDKHCLDHSAAAYDKFNGAGTYTVDGVTFTVSGETVTVEGGDAELCVKAATGNSGTVALEDGGSYTVDFVNGGGNNPAISYLVVYDVTATETGGDDTGGDDTGSGEPCRMIDSTVDEGTAWFEIGPEDCEGTVGPVSFSTYKLPGGKIHPFDEQVVWDHAEDNGASYPEGEYTLDASIDGLCAWQSDLYVGDSQDHAPHDHYLDGMNVGWDYHEDENCFDDTAGDDEGSGDETDAVDADVALDAESVCVGDDIVFTATNDSDVKVLFKVEFGHKTVPFHLDAGETYTKDVPALVEGSWTLEWTATAGGHEPVSGTLMLVVDDCDTDGDDTDGDDTDGDEVDLPDHEWGDNIEICHRTRSATNPYRPIGPAVASIVKAGHGGHEGPIFDPATMTNGDTWGDIIPAFTYTDHKGDEHTFDGLNWPEGESVMEDGCVFGDGEAAAPAISIDKSADVAVVTLVGEDDAAEVTYTYEITNTGNVTLDLTELSDDKIADLDLGDLDDTTLDADESTTVTQIVDLGADDFDEDGEHTNVVTVTGVIEGGDATDTDDTVSDTDDETVTVIVEELPDVEPGVGSDGSTVDLGVTDLEVCVGSDVNLTLTTTATDDVDVTFAGDLDLDDTTMSATNPWTETLTGLVAGTYTIDYTVDLGLGSTETGSFTITVEDCGEVDDGVTEQPPVDEDEDDTPGTPSVPVDGDDEDDDTPATPADVDLDLELVCPDGVPSYVVTATGEGLEATEGVLSIAYGNTDVPFEAVTITLGDETELEWPIGIDDLDTSEFVVWVTVGETASEMVTLDTAEYDELCTEVLDEVIDAPDTGDTPATPDAPDDSEGPGTDIPVDNDEVVRDEEDEVLDVVLDQPADEVVSVDADDTISVGGSDEELAYTGSSLLALLMTGLVALFSGMGLLRRRS